MKLILASASSARRAMLAQAGIDADSIPAAVDEDMVKQSMRAEGASAAETATALADLKAERISRRYPDSVVIGSDQLLVCEGVWFDKAPDLESARTRLRDFRGRAHHLVTSVVCAKGGSRIWHHVETPCLHMRRFSEDFLNWYLAQEGEALLGSVGCYRLEGPGIQLFDRIEGDYFSILGMPLLPLLSFLRQHQALTA
ncbi:Septum formation protein Maf [Granulibacter bethesdensis]|uniref:Nucleoside triphosphate pyrophosphatase n=1 Tax=Granulibacter bethesdensis TaxID=364410 RepID=A0AAC9P7E5_9PROT|nr:Maf family protein [Granulibacter bethesdensis]APH53223.1 Septum formation protein Maf [Granulibacter bethesdensis]APH60799.1 Septum formation protein Maf [Granulibacter bethesdensis]